jgi:hypothetical protein
MLPLLLLLLKPDHLLTLLLLLLKLDHQILTLEFELVLKFTTLILDLKLKQMLGGVIVGHSSELPELTEYPLLVQEAEQ